MDLREATPGVEVVWFKNKKSTVLTGEKIAARVEKRTKFKIVIRTQDGQLHWVSPEQLEKRLTMPRDDGGEGA